MPADNDPIIVGYGGLDMSGTFKNISIKNLFRQTAVFLSAIFSLLTVPPEADGTGSRKEINV
jgi:hypothetical protein